jgi:hypothetical protein
MDTTFSLVGAAANGTWTLTFVDTFLGADFGDINAAMCTLTITQPTPPGDPEVNVRHNSNSIASGGTVNLGNVSSTPAPTLTLEVQNQGALQNLQVGAATTQGTPTNAAPTYGALTPASPVPPAGSATIAVTVNPAGLGSFSFTVSIPNNDITGGEDPYLVTVTGNIVPPAMQGTYTIANGNPGSAYDFGDLGAAFNALESVGMTGPVVLELYDVGGPFVSSASYGLGANGTATVPVSGISTTNTLTIRAATGSSPVIGGSGVPDPYTGGTTGTIVLFNVGNVTFEGLTITGGVGFGIMSYAITAGIGDNLVVRRCRIHGITQGAAFFCYDSSGGGIGPNNVLIENNMIWNVAGDVTWAGGDRLGVLGARRPGTNWVVRHNTIMLNSASATANVFFAAALGSLANVSNNVVYIANAGACYYTTGTGAPPTTADRNVVFLGGTAVMHAATPTWAAWQGTGRDANSVNADPLFISIAATPDLHLQVTSPAVNLAVGSTTAIDIDGDIRPQGVAADSGADEALLGPPPVMDIQRNLVSIIDGGTTDVSDVPLAGGPFTFTILNTGAGDLFLTGTPSVQLTPGSNVAAGTVVQSQPATTTIANTTGTETFSVYIEPAGLGAFSLSILIPNNDPASNPYNFTITGNGVPNNAPAMVDLNPGSSFSGSAGGPFSTAVDPAAVLANASILLTDPDSDDITVTAITPVGTAPTGISVTPPAAPAQPVVLTWTGTADATNPPGTYEWQVDFEDAVNGTPMTAFVTITINDLQPGHTGAGATGGTGAPGNPYVTQFVQGDNGSISVDLATVTDPNTTQPLSITSTTPSAANPAGGAGFGFTLGGTGLLTVTPNGTLIDADRGIHNFDVQITDGSNNITIAARVTVVGIAPTFTSVPVTTATPGSLYAYTAVAAGTPAPSLALASVLPAWLTFNATTGELTGTPGNSDAKTTVTVTLTASNGVTPNGTQTFDINVARSPDAKSKDNGSDGCAAGGTSGATILLLLLAVAGVLVAGELRRRRA